MNLEGRNHNGFGAVGGGGWGQKWLIKVMKQSGNVPNMKRNHLQIEEHIISRKKMSTKSLFFTIIMSRKKTMSVHSRFFSLKGLNIKLLKKQKTKNNHPCSGSQKWRKDAASVVGSDHYIKDISLFFFLFSASCPRSMCEHNLRCIWKLRMSDTDTTDTEQQAFPDHLPPRKSYRQPHV